MIIKHTSCCGFKEILLKMGDPEVRRINCLLLLLIRNLELNQSISHKCDNLQILINKLMRKMFRFCYVELDIFNYL